MKEESYSDSVGVVWLTGLPGAGKTTIANHLVDYLTSRQCRVEMLDGDAIREVLPCGFTANDRDRHVRSVGFLASRLEYHGVTVVVALVSPFRDSRVFARSLCQRFVEVHVSTSLSECQRRDPKGLYAAALAGRLRGMTGVDAPYEPPLSPEVTLDTLSVSADTAVQLICASLQRQCQRCEGSRTAPTARMQR
jgi:adenylylsulfate kinase